MTILEEFLIEEQERCERHRGAILAEMQEPDISPERMEQCLAVLQRIEGDLRRLKRALEPNEANVIAEREINPRDAVDDHISRK